jgi:two-component system sensor histidine kinase UhpB
VFSTALDGLDDCLAPEATIHVFRIVQEAVHNVVRHSGATEARIVATRQASAVEIAIEDNGGGFDAAGTAGRGGFGLMGMRERALAVGGTLAVESTDRGTHVRLSIPCGATADV